MEPTSLEFEVDGQTLKGKLYTPLNISKRLAVLFFHGWTCRPNDRAATVLLQQGFYAMTFSMRGHNDSEGDIMTISRRKSFDDALAAYDLFASKLPVGTHIVIAGNSYGGYMAILLASAGRCRAITPCPCGVSRCGF